VQTRKQKKKKKRKRKKQKKPELLSGPADLTYFGRRCQRNKRNSNQKTKWKKSPID
jgi:hypothetical protein